MAKAVIGTLAMFEQPLSPSALRRRADRHYFEQITLEELQQERNAIFSATPEDIRHYAGLLKTVTEQNFFSVVGNDSKMKSAQAIFGRLEELVK
ncbi:hypothetical protein D3C75_1055920 [compost metagenome]